MSSQWSIVLKIASRTRELAKLRSGWWEKKRCQ
jgi:hypothetical protein